MKLTKLSMDKFVFNPYGLRIHYDQEIVERLAGSIIQNGLISPLTVIERNGVYPIIDGNYRYLALKHLKWEKPVPAALEDLSDEEALMRAVVANWHRRNFTFMDKAKAVKKLKDAGYSPEEITRKLELKHPRSIYHYLPFAEVVPEEVKDILKSHPRVTRRHGEALVMLEKSTDNQRKLAEQIVTEKLTGPQAIREADKILHPKEYVREAEPWTCDCCEKEQKPEETKSILKLCPTCFAEFEVWRHERMEEPT